MCHSTTLVVGSTRISVARARMQGRRGRQASGNQLGCYHSKVCSYASYAFIHAVLITADTPQFAGGFRAKPSVVPWQQLGVLLCTNMCMLFALCVPLQVQLQGAALCCGNFPGLGGDDRLALPPLNAVVLDFPQSHLDPQHNVAGMLGQEVRGGHWAELAAIPAPLQCAAGLRIRPTLLSRCCSCILFFTRQVAEGHMSCSGGYGFARDGRKHAATGVWQVWR